MDKPISKGDLVMVVRPTPCCRKNGSMGLIYTVQRVDDRPGQCEGCGYIRTESANAVINGNEGYDVRRLKRIPPLSELENVQTGEELTV